MNKARSAAARKPDARFAVTGVDPDASSPALAGLASRCTPSLGRTTVETIEQQLVRAGDGEQRAFAEVYDATSPRVFGLVLRIVLDRTWAEEVTHEVYLEAWRRAKRFDPEQSTAIAWMLEIAHSRAVDRVRGARTNRARISLSHGQAFELARVHGRTRTDIGEGVGGPLGAVKTRSQAGATGLRDVLASPAGAAEPVIR